MTMHLCFCTYIFTSLMNISRDLFKALKSCHLHVLSLFITKVRIYSFFWWWLGGGGAKAVIKPWVGFYIIFLYSCGAQQDVSVLSMISVPSQESLSPVRVPRLY